MQKPFLHMNTLRWAHHHPAKSLLPQSVGFIVTLWPHSRVCSGGGKAGQKISGPDMKPPLRGGAWGRTQCWQRSGLHSFRLHWCSAALGIMFVLAGFAEYFWRRLHAYVSQYIQWGRWRLVIEYFIVICGNMLPYKMARWEWCRCWAAKMCREHKGGNIGETVREEKWIRTTFLSLYFADTLLQVHCSPLACSQISVC